MCKHAKYGNHFNEIDGPEDNSIELYFDEAVEMVQSTDDLPEDESVEL